MEKDLTSAILIRTARPEDAAAIAKLHVDTWRSAYSGIMPSEFLDSLRYEDRETRWRKSIQDQDGNCRIVAEHPKDGIIGILAGGKERSNHPDFDGELWAIYTLRAHQGTGVGKKLTMKFTD